MRVGNPELATPVTPFLKWAGGKRWLSALVAQLLQHDTGRHIEPFAGSAACFFASTVTKTLLCDINAELIGCYQIVRDRPEELITGLSSLGIDPETFYAVRKQRPRSALARAIRFLYLNRTAFNGLYRVNLDGAFNVPFGCKPTTVLCDVDVLRACSIRLAHATLITATYSEALARATANDSVFVDPPYTVKHNYNAFRRYNEHLFSWSDQVRLARRANALAERGIRLVIANAFHIDVRRLYSPTRFHAFAISRSTNMAATPDKRGTCEELLLVSHSLGFSRRAVRRLIDSEFPGRVQSARLLST
jgi:DNA adenine methylase